MVDKVPEITLDSHPTHHIQSPPVARRVRSCLRLVVLDLNCFLSFFGVTNSFFFEFFGLRCDVCDSIGLGLNFFGVPNSFFFNFCGLYCNIYGSIGLGDDKIWKSLFFDVLQNLNQLVCVLSNLLNVIVGRLLKILGHLLKFCKTLNHLACFSLLVGGSFFNPLS